MPNCAIKKGFFLFRKCETLTGQMCTVCKRAVCTTHISKAQQRVAVEQIKCVECYGKQVYDPTAKRAHSGRTWRGHAFGYRTHYYSTHTWYHDRYYSHHYDDSDYRSVDQKTSEGGALEEDKDADFADS